jgi:hypothetical protein
MGVGGQRHAPAALPSRKEMWYIVYRKLGRPQCRSGQVRKISPSMEFDPRTVRPVASRCTHYAIPACCMDIYIYMYLFIYIYILPTTFVEDALYRSHELPLNLFASEIKT